MKLTSAPHEKVSLHEFSVVFLAYYAEDLVLLHESHDILRTLFGQLEEGSQEESWFEIKESKTEYSIVKGRIDRDVVSLNGGIDWK